VKLWLRPVVAGIVGYALIVLMTSAGFSVWLEDQPLHTSGRMMLAGLVVAVSAGLAGGSLSRALGGSRYALISTLLLLAFDSAYVLFFFEGTASSWFDALGSFTLIGSTLAGAWLVERALSSRPRGSAPQSAGAP
jgi:hypothetical protein